MKKKCWKINLKRQMKIIQKQLNKEFKQNKKAANYRKREDFQNNKEGFQKRKDLILKHR